MTVTSIVTTLPAKPGGAPVRVLPGERLLSPDPQPAMPAARMDLATLVELTRACGLRGRGGAGFPFATKLTAAASARGRPVVVINAAEGEPASSKDSTLLLTRPHLVIDGAMAAAGALRAGAVHIVVAAERDAVVRAVRQALDERASRSRRERDAVRVKLHVAESRFVAGQAQAVLQLLAGRPGLPVTAWAPEAISGLNGKPTLLSNAETWAQVATAVRLGAAGYTALGDADEPGTLLLTVAGDTGMATVLEVPSGTSLSEVLVTTGHDPAGPVLTGGYHGRWLRAGAALDLPLTRAAVDAAGGALGAGVVLPLAPGLCPVSRTADITAYLAGETAGRCGPCRNGLPALAGQLHTLARRGQSASADVSHLLARVTGRGACAHPDGTSRLVASLLVAFPDEVAAHEQGRCDVALTGEWPQ